LGCSSSPNLMIINGPRGTMGLVLLEVLK
jgi:hypothetical protein